MTFWPLHIIFGNSLNKNKRSIEREHKSGSSCADKHLMLAREPQVDRRAHWLKILLCGCHGTRRRKGHISSTSDS